MQSAQGGGLTAEDRRRREQVRLDARKFGQGASAAEIAAELWVSERSVRKAGDPSFSVGGEPAAGRDNHSGIQWMARSVTARNR